MVCGSADFIAGARRARQVVGGGMRQAGIIAAAGVVALEQMTDRLVEDHVRAHRLAEGLAMSPAIEVAPVTTNILYFQIAETVSKSPTQVVSELVEQGVLVNSRGGRLFRAVTHYGIDDEDIERAVEVMKQVMA
jgi:threonine aldolase